MNASELKTLVLESLESLKAVNIETIDLAGKTDIADYMIIASGTSDRHLHALADKIHGGSKAAGWPPRLGTGGFGRHHRPPDAPGNPRTLRPGKTVVAAANTQLDTI